MARLGNALLCFCTLGVYAQLGDEVGMVQMGLGKQSKDGDQTVRGDPREEIAYRVTHDEEQRQEWMGAADPAMAALVTFWPTAKPRRKFNCSTAPSFCKPPFHCNAVDMDNVATSLMKPVARDGHAYLGSWCNYPEYFKYVKTCIRDREVGKAAKMHHRGLMFAGGSELEGSTCFIEGHCTNTAVNENTTLKDAEAMCDARFGHEGWAYWTPGTDKGYARLNNAGPLAQLGKDVNQYVKDPKVSRYVTKLACAMGSYHCDVMSCKESYCKQEYYIRKYGHLQPLLPGHQLRQHLEPL